MTRLGLAALLALTACTTSPEGYIIPVWQKHMHHSGTSGTTRVVDGDTLDLAGTRYRLWGVDAPEMSTARGRAAKAYMQRLTRTGRVTCSPTGDRSYDRLVARCYVDGRDLAAALVSAGHARDVPRYSGGYYGR